MLKHDLKEGSTPSTTPEVKRDDALPHVDQTAAQKRLMAGASPNPAPTTAEPTQRDSVVLNYLKSLLPGAKQPPQVAQRQAQVNFEVEEAVNQRARFESTADNHELSDPSIEEAAVEPIALFKGTQAERIALERELNLVADAAVKKELHQALLLLRTREAILERINTVHDLEQAARSLAQTTLRASNGEAKDVENIKRIVLESESTLDKMIEALFVTREKIPTLQEKLRELEVQLRQSAAQETSEPIRLELEKFAQAAHEELKALQNEQSILAGSADAGSAQGAVRSPAVIAEIAMNMERIIRAAEPRDTADEASALVRQALEKLALVESGTHVDVSQLLMRQRSMLLVEAAQRTLTHEGSSPATLKKVSSGLQSAALILQDAAALPGLDESKKAELKKGAAEVLAQSYAQQSMAIEVVEVADLWRSSDMLAKSLSLLIAGDTSLEKSFSFTGDKSSGVQGTFTSEGEETNNHPWSPTYMRILPDHVCERLASKIAALPEDKRSHALNLLAQIAEKRLQQYELSGRSEESRAYCAATYQVFQVIERVSHLADQARVDGRLPYDHECAIHASMAEARFYMAFGAKATADKIVQTFDQLDSEMSNPRGWKKLSTLQLTREIDDTRKRLEQQKIHEQQVSGDQKSRSTEIVAMLDREVHELEKELQLAQVRDARIRALYDQADQFRSQTYLFLAQASNDRSSYAARSIGVAEQCKARKLREATTLMQEATAARNSTTTQPNELGTPQQIFNGYRTLARAQEAQLRFNVVLAYGGAALYDECFDLLKQYKQEFGRDIPEHISPTIKKLEDLKAQGTNNIGAGMAAILNEARTNGSIGQSIGLTGGGMIVGGIVTAPIGLAPVGMAIGSGVGWLLDTGINVYHGGDRVQAAFSSGVSGIDSRQTAWNAAFFAVDALTVFLPLKGAGKVASSGADALGAAGRATTGSFGNSVVHALGRKPGVAILGASVGLQGAHYADQYLSILNASDLTPEQRQAALQELNTSTGISAAIQSALFGTSVILPKAAQKLLPSRSPQTTIPISDAQTRQPSVPEAPRLQASQSGSSINRPSSGYSTELSSSSGIDTPTSSKSVAIEAQSKSSSESPQPATSTSSPEDPKLTQRRNLKSELQLIPQQQRNIDITIKQLEIELTRQHEILGGQKIFLRLNEADPSIAPAMKEQIRTKELQISDMEARLAKLRQESAAIQASIDTKIEELNSIRLDLLDERIGESLNKIDAPPSQRPQVTPAEVAQPSARTAPPTPATNAQLSLEALPGPKPSTDPGTGITRRDSAPTQTKPRITPGSDLEELFTRSSSDRDLGSDGTSPSTRSPQQPPQPFISRQSTATNTTDLPNGMEFDLDITWRESGHQSSPAKMQNSLGGSSSTSGGVSVLEPPTWDSFTIPTKRPHNPFSQTTKPTTPTLGSELTQALPQQQSAARKRVAVADRPQPTLDPVLANLQKQMDEMNRPKPPSTEVANPSTLLTQPRLSTTTLTPAPQPLAPTLSTTNLRAQLARNVVAQQPLTAEASALKIVDQPQVTRPQTDPQLLTPARAHINDAAISLDPEKLRPLQSEFEAQIQRTGEQHAVQTNSSSTLRPLATPQDTPLGRRVYTAPQPSESPLIAPRPYTPETAPLSMPETLPQRQRSTITKPAPVESPELPSKRLARELSPAPSLRPELAPLQKNAPAAKPKPEPEERPLLSPLPRTAPQPQAEPRPQPQPQPQSQPQRDPQPQTETRTETQQRQRRRKELEFPSFDVDPTDIDRKKPAPPAEEKRAVDSDRAKSKQKKYTARRSKKKIVGGPVGAITLEEHQLAPDALFGAALITKDVGGES